MSENTLMPSGKFLLYQTEDIVNALELAAIALPEPKERKK